MTTAVRREVLEVLAQLSDCCPEIRFGQLVANLSYLAKGPTNEAIWDMEDHELLLAARKHLNDWCEKTAARSEEARTVPLPR
jgi:hypothetical protein